MCKILLIFAVIVLAICAVKHTRENFAEITYDYAQSPMQQFSSVLQQIQDGMCGDLYKQFIADPTPENEAKLFACKGQQNLRVKEIAGMFGGQSR
jgi:hypothetical protein